MSDKKIKVCFLFGGREGGGMSRSALQLLENIDSTRFEVKALLCENGCYAKLLLEKNIVCDFLNTGWPPQMRVNTSSKAKIDYFGILKMPFWFILTVFKLVFYLRRNRPDIIHTNYHHFHLIAVIGAFFCNSKTVLHWRGLLNWKRSGLFYFILRKLLLRASWSIANSDMTKGSVEFFVGSRISTIYNGIELDGIGNSTGKLRGILDIGQSNKIVGMVGSLNPIKGHKVFIESASVVSKLYPESHFVYIGGQTAAGQNDYLLGLQGQVRELGLEGRFHFLGHRDDARELTGDFDVAVVCTLPPGEGFGLVIIEAMAYGVAVISTDVGAAVELISDSKTGLLVPANDSVVLADKIKLLFENEELRQIISQAGKEDCFKRFNIMNTVSEVEKLYETLL